MSKLSPWRPFWSPTHFPWPQGIFDEFLVGPKTAAPTGTSWVPHVDVTETPEAYVVKAELPGLDPREVEITLKERTLTLKGEKHSETKREDEAWHVVERRAGSFSRTFTFPEPVSAESVSATAENGLLTIEVRKIAEIQPKKIQIDVKTD